MVQACNTKPVRDKKKKKEKKEDGAFERDTIHSLPSILLYPTYCCSIASNLIQFNTGEEIR